MPLRSISRIDENVFMQQIPIFHVQQNACCGQNMTYIFQYHVRVGFCKGAIMA